MSETIKSVQLKRSESYGFGFSILGGSGSDLPPIIYDIIEKSPADVSGELEAGDVILQVNDREVFTLSTKEVLKCLRLSSDLVTLTLKRDPNIKAKVRAFLAASHDMDTMRQAITKEDQEDLIVRKSPSRHLLTATNGDNSSSSSNGSSNRDFPPTDTTTNTSNGLHHFRDGPGGSGGSVDRLTNGQRIAPAPSRSQHHPADEVRTPPRFETFMMTGDLILNLNPTPTNGAVATTTTTVPPPPVPPSSLPVSKSAKRHHHEPSVSGDETIDTNGRANSTNNRTKGTKRESPSLCSPVADKKAAFGYAGGGGTGSGGGGGGGGFVRTSRSEDHLQQQDHLTAVDIDIDEDIASSLNTLLDTRPDRDDPASERIVWTYNAPIGGVGPRRDSAGSSSSPHSSSPSSPLQSPTYRPLNSPSPDSKPRRAGRNHRAQSPPSSPSSLTTTNSFRFDERIPCASFGYPHHPEPLSPTTSDDQSRATDLETDVDESREGSPSRHPQHQRANNNSSQNGFNGSENSGVNDASTDDELPQSSSAKTSRNHGSDGHKKHGGGSSGSNNNNSKSKVELSERRGKSSGASGSGGSGDSQKRGVDSEGGGGENDHHRRDEENGGGGRSVGSRLDSPRKSASPPPDDDSDIESLHSFHYSPKAVDMPSACRLAKRLYSLEGFKKSDVSRQLSRNNEFSRVVAEEYLKYFEFTGDALDTALRKFLQQFCLTGETQERERVLVHFSKRYLDCNPGGCNSQDAVHTLTCALMLLNTDLHGQNIGRKMTCAEYIDNLADLNDGENFPKDVLKALYHSIKSHPLEWAVDDEEVDDVSGPPELQRRPPDERPNSIGHNPFLEVPNATTATEYKKGYVMRKCCIEPNGKRTPLGKRGWKMFYATLKDLVLYLHKDEQGFKKNQLYDSLHNSIRIHHALATKASDYTKKQHVFRLQTSDLAEYLFQTSDSKELQGWIDTINFVSSSLSAPPLAGAVGSQRKFQRPLLPCTHTKLNLREQLHNHETRSQLLEQELEDHRSRPPERGSKSRHLHEYQEKENYLQSELKRYRTYAFLLRSKMAQHPELEPSLVETFIGEVDEREGDGDFAVVAKPTTGAVTSADTTTTTTTPEGNGGGAVADSTPTGSVRSVSDRFQSKVDIQLRLDCRHGIAPYTLASHVYLSPVVQRCHPGGAAVVSPNAVYVASNGTVQPHM